MPEPAPTIAIGAARKLLATLDALGIDAKRVLAKVDLPPRALDDPDARIHIATLHDLWEAALPLLGRPDAALATAQTYVPGDYGIVGFVAMNSATLAEGIGHVIRYGALWTDEPTLRFSAEGTLRLGYRRPFADRPGLRCANEAALAEVLHAARLLTQRSIAPLEVRFSHPGPGDTSAHERFFGSEVLFGQADDAMVFSGEALSAVLPKADAMLGQYLRGLASETLAKRAGAEASPRDRLRDLLAEALPRGLPTAEEVAKQLGTSERTLRRRLEEEGTSFRDVVDTTRAELARRYVRDGRMPLTEVAFALGFAEPAAFHRAFKRWTGTTPSSLRAEPVAVERARAKRARPSTRD